MPRISVIMRSRNSAWSIGSALAGLFSQEYKDFELVIIDSSTDETMDIVGKYPHRAIAVELEKYIPGIALNRAIEQCASELIVFQNSDVIPLHHKVLGNLIAAFDDPKVVAAFGRQLPRPEAEAWVRREHAESFPASGKAPPWITFSLPLAGLRRVVWEQHPFYSDAFSSEDTEWGNWALSNGHRVVYVPTADVMHSHNYTLKEQASRRFVEGEADAFIYRKQETLLRTLGKWVRAVGRDALAHVHAVDYHGMSEIPLRRWGYHWHYYRGHKLGERRLQTGDNDVTVGRKVVLNRYR